MSESNFNKISTRAKRGRAWERSTRCSRQPPVVGQPTLAQQAGTSDTTLGNLGTAEKGHERSCYPLLHHQMHVRPLQTPATLSQKTILLQSSTRLSEHYQTPHWVRNAHQLDPHFRQNHSMRTLQLELKHWLIWRGGTTCHLLVRTLTVFSVSSITPYMYTRYEG